VFIDRPLEVLPLKEALFMGKRKLEVRDENDDHVNYKSYQILERRPEFDTDIQK